VNAEALMGDGLAAPWLRAFLPGGFGYCVVLAPATTIPCTAHRQSMLTTWTWRRRS